MRPLINYLIALRLYSSEIHQIEHTLDIRIGKRFENQCTSLRFNSLRDNYNPLLVLMTLLESHPIVKDNLVIILL